MKSTKMLTIADTVGLGEVIGVQSRNKIRGVSTSSDRSSPSELTGSDGSIGFIHRRTWVELAMVGMFAAVR